MGKKDKKKSTDRKARVAEKTARKADKKTSKKGAPNDLNSPDPDDLDIDSVLAEYARQQTLFHKVTETILPAPPPPRANATLTPHPNNPSELLLFGGELFNGAIASFFNDLFVYNIPRNEWKHITSPNSPLPRSGHWMCPSGGKSGIGTGRGAVWLFGGEFSSPKQGTFYHYGDFWRLDCDRDKQQLEWEKIEPKGKGGQNHPHARSGHRMVAWKQYIVLFGGFQDTSSSTKYLNDLWLFDTVNYVWISVVLPAHSQRPEARSSFSFLPHEAGAVLYGGYSRQKTDAATGGGKKGQKQSKNQSTTKPVIHTDTWLLRISPENPGTMTRWERRKKPGNPPNPPRVGVTMAGHKGRGIIFGGVYDTERDEEGLESVFFDNLFAWGVERNRFFELQLRKPRQQKPGGGGEGRRGGGGGGGGFLGRKGRAEEDAEELLANLRKLEALTMKGGGNDDATAEEKNAEETAATEDAARATALEAQQQQQPLSLTLPHPRFNAALAVQEDMLYIYGGTFEKGDREYTFDEMYAIDLVKLDGVRTIFQRQDELAWIDEDEDEEGEEDEDEDDEDDEDDDDEDAEEDPEAATKAREIARQKAEGAERKRLAQEAAATAAEEALAAEPPAEEDKLPFPRPFESLREFFARTSAQWQETVLAGTGGDVDYNSQGRTVKEMRKEAFAVAEERWWAVREEVRALEDEQEEAGIGEVVSLKDKEGGGGGLGGAGRRR